MGVDYRRYALMAWGCGPNQIPLGHRSGSAMGGVHNIDGSTFVDTIKETRDLAEKRIRGYKMNLIYSGAVCRVKILRHRAKGHKHEYTPVEEIHWAPIATAKTEEEKMKKDYLKKGYLTSRWEKRGNMNVLLVRGWRGT